MIIRILLLLCITTFFSIAHSKDVILTSYRSGTHWTFYLLNHFSNRGFLLNRSKECDKFIKTFDISKPFFLHSHSAGSISIKKNDRLLLLIRDYHESIGFFYVNTHYNKKIASSLQSYGKNLIYFDNHPSENKIIVYYEDLIKTPKKQITKILNFFDVSTKRLPDLMSNLEYHKLKCIEMYNQFFSSTHKDFNIKSASKRKGVYKDQLSSKEKAEIERSLLEKTGAKIFQKYLSRYSS